jgi:Replication regulatory protein RepB.
MKTGKEDQILTALRKAEPKKKRVTFFITEKSKDALASWCEKHDVTESGAIEEMIRATVPERYFKKGE